MGLSKKEYYKCKSTAAVEINTPTHLHRFDHVQQDREIK